MQRRLALAYFVHRKQPRKPMTTTTLKLNAAEVEALRQALLCQHTDHMTSEEIHVSDRLYRRVERALDRLEA